MKLSDIQAMFDAIEAEEQRIAPAANGDELGERAEAHFMRLPRVKYADLPAKMKKAVRERFTLDVLRQFLIDLNGFDQLWSSVLTEEQITHILTKIRASATYVIESMQTTPELYGNYAVEAFVEVCANINIPQPKQDNTQTKTDEKSIEDLRRMVSVTYPSDIIHPIDLITKRILNNELPYDKTWRIKSGKDITIRDENGKKSREPLAPIVSISLLDLPPNVKVSRKFTEYDSAVFKAICSLFNEGNRRFTGQSIYCMMLNNPDAKATNETLNDIDESWTRLTSAQALIDTGTMGDAYNFKRWKHYRRIIEGGKDTFIIANQYGRTSVTVYSMLEEPLLLEYGKALNQLDRYPALWHNTPVNKDKETIIIQNIMIDHIHAIPRISNHILYETLWSAINADLSDRTYKKRMHQKICKMLDYWKEQGFIHAWQDVKSGTTLHHIAITKKDPAADAERAKKRVTV